MKLVDMKVFSQFPQKERSLYNYRHVGSVGYGSH